MDGRRCQDLAPDQGLFDLGPVWGGGGSVQLSQGWRFLSAVVTSEWMA